jgi:hypothetical protein
LSIIQQNREERPPNPLVANADSAVALEYPHPHRRKDTDPIPVPTALWSGLLVFGILILLARSPINAPTFDQLTQYVCDPLPPLPSVGGRTQTYNLRITCRSGDKIVYQRGYPFDGSNPNASFTCRRTGGTIRIWRYANPSPYGPYVFHSTCNDSVLVFYNNRVRAYEATQRFVIVVGWLLIGVGGIGLARKILVSRRRLANTT